MNALLTDPLLRRVTDANPEPTSLTGADSERAEVLLARLIATPRGTAATDSPVPARRRLATRVKTRVAAASAAVVAVVGAVVLIPTSASAGVVLLQAADAAGLQPHATGEYWYEHWQIQDQLPFAPTGETAPITYERENWVSRERFVMRDESSAALRALEAGRTTLDPDDIRVSGDYLDEHGNPAVPTFGEFTWDELDALPTEPVALRAALLDATPASGHGRDFDLWSTAQGILFSSPAQPELRRALWQVLAGIPDVHLLGSRTDALGREGTAVEVRFDDYYPVVLVLDPTTGALLESSYTDPDGTNPRVYTLVVQGPRDTAPTLDPPLCGPGSVPFVSC